MEDTARANDVPHRVLLVDGDELDRAAVGPALTATGSLLSVTECATAERALELLGEGGFACVLLDYVLPGATALEVLPEIRARAVGAPVIVLTARGDDQVAVALMKAGASDYIAKDRLDAPRLARALEQALSLSEARGRVIRAERAQRVYLTRLRRLLEVTPDLYGVPTVGARAEVALLSTQALFAAEEVFLRLSTIDPPLVLATRGERVEPVLEGGWHSAALAAADRATDCEGSRVVVDDAGPEGLRYAMVLCSHERARIGVLAMRMPRPEEAFAELTESLFAQLGDMVAGALENAHLFEEMQRAVSARDAVMAVASHDLRSPLHSFRIGLEILRTDGGPDVNRVIARMDRAVTQMNRLIDDLLDVSRIERRELQVTPTPVGMLTLMEEVAAIHGPLAQTAGVELRLPPRTDTRVLADRHRVAQVFANLISNALKVSSEGGSVAVEVESGDADVRVCVVDSGPGIATERHARVFERYYRQGGKGLGLGLFIAKAIVEAHGGRIWVESAPGRGARLRVKQKRA